MRCGLCLGRLEVLVGRHAVERKGATFHSIVEGAVNRHIWHYHGGVLSGSVARGEEFGRPSGFEASRTVPRTW